MSVSRHPPHTHAATILHLQSDVRLLEKPEKLNFLVKSSSCFCLSKSWHLSFQHSSNTSTLTAHSSAWASSECSHSHLSLLATTCFQLDTCLQHQHTVSQGANRLLQQRADQWLQSTTNKPLQHSRGAPCCSAFCIGFTQTNDSNPPHFTQNQLRR